jgi:hypothetical protein
MDALQFSLFFFALVVGYVVLHLRMVRFEEHLQKLAGIRALDDRLRGLDERLQALTTVFEKAHFERLTGQLERLHEDLEDVREATSSVRTAVVEIPPPAPVAVPTVMQVAPELPPRSEESAGSRIRSLVETRLLQLGYRELQLLSDLAHASLEGDCEVLVEAERAGMPVKGRVLLRNGAVRDVALQTAASMFP